MSDSPIAPTSPRSMARRQAAVTALVAFAASLLIELTVVNVASRDAKAQVERRFVALATERERQIEALVRQEFRAAAVVAADARWPDLIRRAREGDPGAAIEARVILNTAAGVPPGYGRVDVVSEGRVLVGTDEDGPAAYPPRVLEGGQRMTAPFAEPEGVFAYVTAPLPVDPPATLVAKAVAYPIQQVLQDTSPLGLGGSLEIVPTGSPLLTALVRQAGEEGTIERGFTEVDSQLERRLVHWQPIQFNPGDWQRWRLVASVPASEAYASVNRLRLWMLGIGVPLALLVTAAAYLAARRLNRRLSLLTERARRVARTGETDFGEERPPADDDELAALAGAFDAMGRRVGADLQEARDDAEREREARSRLMAELALAREVQSRLYPAEPLSLGGYDMAGVSEPAEELCGDYFDYFACEEDGSILFALGDVSGHGVGPSLMMVEVRSVLRSLRTRPQPLADFAARLNEQLVEESPSDRFVSLLVGRLRPDTGEIEYVGAGHRAMLVRGDGSVETLESTGMLLGIVSGVPFETGRAALQPGELVCVLSDGLEETESPAGDPLGWERLGQMVSAHRDLEPAALIADTLADCVAHAGGAAPKDDRTLLVVRRTGEQGT